MPELDGAAPQTAARATLLPPGRARLLALLVLAFWSAAAQTFFPSLPGRDTGIHSFMTASGIDPLTLYLHYALQVCLAAGWLWLAWRWRGDLSAAASAAWRWSIDPARVDATAGVLAATAFVGMMVEFGFNNPSASLRMFFHEGEWLGLLPILDHWPNPLPHMVLIHGLGVDLLPAWLARTLGQPDAQIAGARAIRFALYGLYCVGFWWLIRATVSAAGVGCEARGRATLFAVATLAATWNVLWWYGGDTVISLPLRRAVLLPQIALCLAIISLPPGSRRHGAAAALGFSLPLGLLWNMGDGAIGLGATVVTAVLLLAASSRTGLLATLAAITASIVVATLAASAAFPGVWAEVADWLGYWSKNGREIWVHRLPDLAMDGPMVWVNLAAHGAALAWGIGAIRRRGVAGALRADPQATLLLAVSAIYMRVPLELGLFHYFGVSGLFVVLLGIHLALRHRIALMHALEGLRLPASPAAAIALALAPITLHEANLGKIPFAAYALVVQANTPDADVLRPETAAALERIRPLFSGQRCTIILDSSATWLHLLGVPPCSRWYVPIQASAPEAQAELVRDLEREAPRHIIRALPPDDLTRSVPASQRLPAVFRHVDEHYEPFIEVEGVEVWRLKY